MVLSSVSSSSRSLAWDYQVRQAYNSNKNDYIYIRQPCTLQQRIYALALSSLLFLGAIFSQRYFMAAKEAFQQAYYGYTLEIASKGNDLFPYETFKRFLSRDTRGGEIENFFLKSSDTSLRLMVLLGPGLSSECPLLDAYLNKAAKTPGQKMSLYLRLLEAIALQGREFEKSTPKSIEDFLVYFEGIKKTLSTSGWKLQSVDESGQLIGCIESRNFSDSIDLCEQIDAYERLVYMQGGLKLVLRQCSQIPSVFAQMQNLTEVVIEDSTIAPEGLSKISSMRHLKFINCEISSCESLKSCERLRVISFKGHQADEVPSNICRHPEIVALEIQGAIASVPLPGPKVESLWLQPSVQGVSVPDLRHCGALKWCHWPLSLKDELPSSNLPPSCRLGYL